MTRLVLDPSIVGVFQHVHERIEVCDSAGKTLGYFHPVEAGNGRTEKDRGSPYCRADLDRFRAEPGGRPRSEILKRLAEQQ